MTPEQERSIHDEECEAFRERTLPKFVHSYVHPGPQDCATYQECHGRAYGHSAHSWGEQHEDDPNIQHEMVEVLQ